MTNSRIILVWFLFCFFGARSQSTTFIDPDYTTILDTEQCNFLYPFAFNTDSQNLEIVDWDLQNFSDNYQRFYTDLKSYASTTESFIAMCYRDYEGSTFVLYCGVTYQIESGFKWLRIISDA